VVFEWKGRIALQAGHASHVKWCLNEKVELLCNGLYRHSAPCLPTKRFNGAGRTARARVGHMPRHTIPMCPNASMCSEPSEVRIAKLAMPRLSSGVWKGRIALQAGHASPVKWCLKEKVLLGKWSAIAMLELQRIRFAGWELTEGQQG